MICMQIQLQHTVPVTIHFEVSRKMAPPPQKNWWNHCHGLVHIYLWKVIRGPHRRPPSLIWEGVAVGWREEFPRPPSAGAAAALRSARSPTAEENTRGLDSPLGLDSPTNNGPTSITRRAERRLITKYFWFWRDLWLFLTAMSCFLFSSFQE
jgi:hypothetical protein